MTTVLRRSFGGNRESFGFRFRWGLEGRWGLGGRWERKVRLPRTWTTILIKRMEGPNCTLLLATQVVRAGSHENNKMVPPSCLVRKWQTRRAACKAAYAQWHFDR